MIELRLIRHALALGQHGNFARAAEALHLTQPSLSRSIASLEEQLGVPLFDRTRKGVTPTAFGRVVLERGEAVLQREADLRREIDLLAGLEFGTLAVGAGPYMAESSVARAIARVAMAHPRLCIRCISADPTEVMRDVLAERIDVGVAAAPGLAMDERLIVEPLPVHRGYFACRPGHPLLQEDQPTLHRVFEFPLVTTVLRGAHAALVSAAGANPSGDSAGGGDFTPQILVNTVAVARMIVRESNAVMPGTAATLAEDVQTGRLIILNVDAPAMRTIGGLIYLRERTLSPATRLFMETLRAVEAEAHALDLVLAAALTVARPPAAARASAHVPA